jgi:DNA-binding CsgD family transcriptional regulator
MSCTKCRIVSRLARFFGRRGALVSKGARALRVVVVGPHADLARTLEETLRDAARVDRISGSLGARASAAVGTGCQVLVLDARPGGDAAALESLARALTRAAVPPRLVLVASGPVAGLASRLRLEPVAPDEVGAVVEELLGLAPGPGAARAAGGNRDEDRSIEAAIRAAGLRFELTATENEVAVHAARGLTNKEIARALDTSTTTTRTHLASICRKVGVASRGELAYVLFRETHVAAAERRAGVNRPIRPVVLLVSANVFLRCFVLQALDASRKLDVATPLPAVGLNLVELGIRFGAIVVDDDVFEQGVEIARAALARGFSPALVLLSGRPGGLEHATGLGAIFLPTPVKPKDLVLVLERALERGTSPVGRARCP